MSRAKYSTVEDTAHREESKQVDEKQHHLVAMHVCKDVHYMVECRDVAGQEYKYVPMEHGVDTVNDFKLMDWENTVETTSITSTAKRI